MIMQSNDVLEVLFETGEDGVYMVFSENDMKTYRMRKADLEYEASHGSEIVGEY